MMSATRIFSKSVHSMARRKKEETQVVQPAVATPKQNITVDVPVAPVQQEPMASEINQTTAQLQAANQAQQQDVRDILLGYQRQEADAVANDAELTRREDARTKFGATTEFLSSLANLIGVGSANAAPQTYRTRTEDWMKEADAKQLERRRHIESLGDKRRALESQLSALKTSGANQIAQYRLEAQQQRIQQQKADAYSAYQIARTSKLDLESALAAEKVKLTEAQTKKNYAEIARINANITKISNDIKIADQKMNLAQQKFDRDAGLVQSQIEVNNARRDNYMGGYYGTSPAPAPAQPAAATTTESAKYLDPNEDPNL